MRERAARVVEIRIGHRRILTDDVHALDFIGMDRIHDLDHGLALLGIEATPHAASYLARVSGVLHRLVVRKNIGMRPASEAPCTLFWPRSGCRPVPGRPTWPQISESAIRQRALSVPWVCWETPMPQNTIALSARAKVRATLRSTSASMPQIGAISSGVNRLDVVGELLEILGIGLDVLLIVELFLDDDVEHAVEHGDVGAVLELHHLPGVALERLAARVHHHELGATLGGLLEEGGGDRMVLGRIGADHDDNVGVLALVESSGHGGRADAFEKSRDRRGMTQPGAVIDIVGAEARAHQFLEQIGLLFEPLAEPKPASARGPSRSRIFSRPEAARSIASSHVASRKCVHGSDGSTRSSAALRRRPCAPAAS